MYDAIALPSTKRVRTIVFSPSEALTFSTLVSADVDCSSNGPQASTGCRFTGVNLTPILDTVTISYRAFWRMFIVPDFSILDRSFPYQIDVAAVSDAIILERKRR